MEHNFSVAPFHNLFPPLSSFYGQTNKAGRKVEKNGLQKKQNKTICKERWHYLSNRQTIQKQMSQVETSNKHFHLEITR